MPEVLPGTRNSSTRTRVRARRPWRSAPYRPRSLQLHAQTIGAPARGAGGHDALRRRHPAQGTARQCRVRLCSARRRRHRFAVAKWNDVRVPAGEPRAGLAIMSNVTTSSAILPWMLRSSARLRPNSRSVAARSRHSPILRNPEGPRAARPSSRRYRETMDWAVHAEVFV